MSLKGKTAIVTGSNSGIGLGVARELARSGATVVLNSFTDNDEDHKLAEDLGREFGVEVRYIQADNFDGTDPQSYLSMYRCGNEPKPSSQWQGENINRFCDEEYDAMLDELAKTGELEKRGEIAKKLNDMLTKESMTIVPLVDRGRVSAHSNTLGGVVLNTWDSELWNAADWYRIEE